MLRFAEHAPLKFHGLKEVAHCKTAEVLNATRAVWFLDGVDQHRQEAIAAILLEFPELMDKDIAGIDHRRMAARFEKEVGPGFNPSSGWQGDTPAVPCSGPHGPGMVLLPFASSCLCLHPGVGVRSEQACSLAWGKAAPGLNFAVLSQIGTHSRAAQPKQ